tara:strand:- start:349 stop:744 length:396 start_codon:yes stop_codon:yes gene_type:complete
MSLKIAGTITKILDIEGGVSKNGKEWKKQGFIIDTGAEYNPQICFSLFGEEKIASLNSFSEGQMVDVSFNLSTREYNGKYYHNVDAWRIEAKENGNGIPAGGPSPISLEAEIEGTSKNETVVDEESDDLPF